jgi:hypothetical protein
MGHQSYDEYKNARKRREAYARRYKTEGKNIFGEESLLYTLGQAALERAEKKAREAGQDRIRVRDADGAEWTGIEVSFYGDGRKKLKVTNPGTSRRRRGQLVVVRPTEITDVRPTGEAPQFTQPPADTKVHAFVPSVSGPTHLCEICGSRSDNPVHPQRPVPGTRYNHEAGKQ